MIAYINITLVLHKSVQLIEYKKNIHRFKFSSLEEAKEVIKVLKHHGIDVSLDEYSHCVTVYNADDFNIDLVGKDFELSIYF